MKKIILFLFLFVLMILLVINVRAYSCYIPGYTGCQVVSTCSTCEAFRAPTCYDCNDCKDKAKYYYDHDRDVYGTTSFLNLCAPNTNQDCSVANQCYSAIQSGDCNDNNPNINPGATEVCNDGKDNDCDGKIDCADSNCNGKSCASGKICVSGNCVLKCTDTTWTDITSCSGCTPTACSSCTGTKTQTSNCGNTRTVSCTIPATGCPLGKCIQGVCKSCQEITDFSGDIYVGLLDSKILQGCYGELTSSSYTLDGRTYSCSKTDIDKDGQIGLSDYTTWVGCCCNPPPCTGCANFNRDDKIDLDDFVIFTNCHEKYYRTFTVGGTTYPCSEADLDEDEQVIGTDKDDIITGSDYWCFQDDYAKAATCNIPELGQDRAPCSLGSDCASGLYCTTNIPGDSHCCSKNGYKWDPRGFCIENIACSPGIVNCIIQQGFANCIFGGKACCTVQYGTVTTKDWIPKTDCIKPY